MENGSGSGEEVVTNGGRRSGGRADERAVQLVRRSLGEAERILERNRTVIREIAENHEAGEHGGLTRNVALIRELNSNIARVVDLYTKLSCCFADSLVLVQNPAAPASATAGADQGYNRPRSSQ